MDYRRTDPEFAERMEYFARTEVGADPDCALDPVTRSLGGAGRPGGLPGGAGFKLALPEALDSGLTPVMARELVYQAVDYLGLGRVLPFLDALNEVLTDRGGELPLPDQSTTTLDDRLEKGVDAQAAIFGEGMRQAWRQGTINRWLGANCFGDYYTRTGLDLRQRELITFCFLAAQGGCEPQLTAHAKGNMNMGNDAELLTKVVLNLACLTSATPAASTPSPASRTPRTEPNRKPPPAARRRGLLL